MAHESAVWPGFRDSFSWFHLELARFAWGLRPGIILKDHSLTYLDTCVWKPHISCYISVLFSLLMKSLQHSSFRVSKIFLSYGLRLPRHVYWETERDGKKEGGRKGKHTNIATWKVGWSSVAIHNAFYDLALEVTGLPRFKGKEHRLHLMLENWSVSHCKKSMWVVEYWYGHDWKTQYATVSNVG